MNAALLGPRDEILEFLRRPFELGTLRVSVLSVLVGLLLLIALLVMVKIVRRTLRNRILPRAGRTPAVAIAVSTLAGYVLLLIGIPVILPVIKSDVHQVEAALLAAAGSVPDVLEKPEPQVRFMGFGDSSLDFELRVWSESLFDRPNKLRSQVNFKIWEELKRQGIEIPYPQRDLYVKELPASVLNRQRDGAPDA